MCRPLMVRTTHPGGPPWQHMPQSRTTQFWVCPSLLLETSLECTPFIFTSVLPSFWYILHKEVSRFFNMSLCSVLCICPSLYMERHCSFSSPRHFQTFCWISVSMSLLQRSLCFSKLSIIPLRYALWACFT